MIDIYINDRYIYLSLSLKTGKPRPKEAIYQLGKQKLSSSALPTTVCQAFVLGVIYTLALILVRNLSLSKVKTIEGGAPGIKPYRVCLNPSPSYDHAFSLGKNERKMGPVPRR